MTTRAGIYIHIPFCERKCTYCNFNTTDYFEDLAARYTKSVAREIGYWGDREPRSPASPPGPPIIDTIFFGGGTPSIVEAEQLGSLVEACRSHFRVSEDSEVTIEINPATFDKEKIEGWKSAGINRASVGVQSFLDHELRSLSRTHTAGEARRTIEALRAAGFDNISLDLIAGLPEQSLADWEFNLNEALKLRPEHLSLYLLEIKPGTQLYAQIDRGHRPRPDDDLAADMYKMICDRAAENGYDHYEISNFALRSKATDFRARHNLKYWTGAPYYGLGCGAHSYDARTRRVNVLRTETYIERVEATGQAVAESNPLSDEDRAAEALFMHLRLIEGVPLEEFRALYGLDILERHGAELDRLTEAGLVEITGGRLRLTSRGLLLSNEVFVAFI